MTTPSVKYCPQCQSVTTVTDSRPRKDGEIVRRRLCPKCGSHHATVEVLLDTEGVRWRGRWRTYRKLNLAKLRRLLSQLLEVPLSKQARSIVAEMLDVFNETCTRGKK